MSCSRQLLFATNVFSTLVGAGTMGIAFFLRSLTPLERPFLQTIPVFALDGAVYVGLLILIAGSLGIIGIQYKSSAAMYAYLFLTTITFFATALGAVIIYFAINRISEGPLGSLITSGGTLIQKEFIASAVRDPSGFRIFQDSLQCCGMSMSAAYVSINGKAPGLESLSEISTGIRCTSGSGPIVAILNAYPPNPAGGPIPEQAQIAADADAIIGRGTGFFCLNRIGNEVAQNMVPFIVACSILSLIQLLNIRAAFVVLYRVPRSQGGFVLQEFKRPPMQPAPTALGRMSQALVNNDFFRPPPRPPANLQPNFFQDARAAGARASAAVFGTQAAEAPPVAPYRMSLMNYQAPQANAGQYGNLAPVQEYGAPPPQRQGQQW